MIRDLTNNKKYILLLSIITIIFIIICLTSCKPVDTTVREKQSWQIVTSIDSCNRVAYRKRVYSYDYYYGGIHYIMFTDRTEGGLRIINYTQDSIGLVKAKREDQYYNKN